jgi:ubiquinone/menaquinone biosynthesis C-methylase UbiE
VPEPHERPGAHAHPRFARCYLAASVEADARGARDHRRALLEGLAGVVCEVGAGQGLNFPHYPSAVTVVHAVEPEPTLRRHAITAAAGAGVVVAVRDGTADALPLPDASCDAVVTSLVLCSVPDPVTALAEIARVLRPGGERRFYEHVRSAHRPIGWLQHAVGPAWSRLAGGCHLDRDTPAAVTAAGFGVTSLQRFGFRPQRGAPALTHVLGRATAPPL